MLHMLFVYLAGWQQSSDSLVQLAAWFLDSRLASAASFYFWMHTPCHSKWTRDEDDVKGIFVGSAVLDWKKIVLMTPK